MKSKTNPFVVTHQTLINLFLAQLLFLASALSTQASTSTLGTSALLDGPMAGTNSVVLAVSPEIATWTATANAAWLHLSVANQSGKGSTNVIFSYDVNPGLTRTGTLTIAGQTFFFTQGGASYIAVPAQLTTLVSTGLSAPYGVTADRSGNVYIADLNNNAIKKWTATNNTVTTLISGVIYPWSVASDGSDNLYINDWGNGAIKKWTATNSAVTTLVSSPPIDARDVAADDAGNVYFTDTYHGAVKKWTAASNTVTTLVSGLNYPRGVAVDVAGNVYIADSKNNAIKKWTAANQTVTTLVSSNLNGPWDVEVDGSGNVYIADTGTNAIKKWTAANNTLTTLASSGVFDVAVDGRGNVYIASTSTNAIKELPCAYVDPTLKTENGNAGSDVLPAVLPATENLLAPFAPTSDQPWLTINGVNNGVVSFSFTATSVNRTAHITVLGQAIQVKQLADFSPPAPPASYALRTTALLEGPATGSDSVALAASPQTNAWTATATTPWLHLGVASQSGTGSANVTFSYDSNPGATRVGTLTIAGQTLTVTQAGATYVAASQSVTTLVSSGLNAPTGVAVDGAGNVYIADTYNNMIKKWTVTNDSVTTPVSSGLFFPWGVAADGAGNIYIADAYTNTIEKYRATDNTVSTLIYDGLNTPSGVAVDGDGNVYIADTYNNMIKKWTATNNVVTTLVSNGLNYPWGVAVDGIGNVYIADTLNDAVKKWTAANNTVITLVSTGLNFPSGVAVDHAGNVYIADVNNNAVKKWTATNNVVTVIASGLNQPWGVAVDGSDNLYIADTHNDAIEELPRAFVDPTGKLEAVAAGRDVLPPVLPATANLLAPFAPTSDQPWLTINGITNGVVSFSFTATTFNRTAEIAILGKVISITQTATIPQPKLIVSTLVSKGVFQFSFNNSTPGATFTILTTTNVATPMANWSVAGTPSNAAPGLFQFTVPVTNGQPCFYRVRSP